MTDATGEDVADEMPLPGSWPPWAEGPIRDYLVHQPEQGDWPWEDHCEGLAGGILAALSRAGVALVPIQTLRDLSQEPPYTTYRRWAQFGDARDADRLEAWDALRKRAAESVDLFGSRDGGTNG